MYNKKLHIHFVGIGGIGMSGIATILVQQGYTISGCDTDIEQKSIRNLRKLGCTIISGNNTPSCTNSTIDILVYSSAIHMDNPEILSARARGIPTIPRALMLAELMRTKYSVAIAGSHGKTTTTSMISHILLSAHFDPTIIIGGHLKSIAHNAQYGLGDFLIAEADESDRSLLHLHATLALITNIDLEHLETYANLDDVKQTFIQFLNNLPFYGKAFICIDDPHARSLLSLSHIRINTYGFTPEAHTHAIDVTLNPQNTNFTVVQKNHGPLGTITVNMPGKHNAQNALGAIALAQELGVPFDAIAQALQSFPGIDRRFSYHGTYKGADVFDDYGHHPQEIRNTLLVAQMRAKKGVTVVFQPHRYSRTQQLWDQFIQTFLQSNINHLIITDIYPANEKPISGISSKRMVEELKAHQPHFTVSYAPYTADHTHITHAIDRSITQDNLLLLLGAGKIHTLAHTLR